MVPDDDQAIVLPWASVMVIMVLLKLAFTCATPDAMFLRSRRRTRVASLPILDPSFAASLNRGRSSSCSHTAGFVPAHVTRKCSDYFFFPAIALAGPLRVREL